MFAQGQVSGQMFVSDKNFRKKAKQKEKNLSFNPEKTPNPKEYKIVFGIISWSKKPLDIPFFSKVNFKNTKNLLNAFGYKNIFLIKIQKRAK